MKILDNPDGENMICVLPNGDTVEVTSISLSGSKATSNQDPSHIKDVVESLPASILKGSQNCMK